MSKWSDNILSPLASKPSTAHKAQQRLKAWIKMQPIGTEGKLQQTHTGGKYGKWEGAKGKPVIEGRNLKKQGPTKYQWHTWRTWECLNFCTFSHVSLISSFRSNKDRWIHKAVQWKEGRSKAKRSLMTSWTLQSWDPDRKQDLEKVREAKTDAIIKVRKEGE